MKYNFYRKNYLTLILSLIIFNLIWCSIFAVIQFKTSTFFGAIMVIEFIGTFLLALYGLNDFIQNCE
jgi:hypothetical protein